MAKAILVLALLSIASVQAFAGSINQFASSVIGFSSQYSNPRWGAIQALGASNVPSAGENSNAWAAAPVDGSNEFISLGFATPVFASGVTIRETMAAGFVYQVDVLDTTGTWHTVWAGVDTSTRYPSSWWWRRNPATGQVLAQASDFRVDFDTTPFLVVGVRIWIDTNTNLGVWEEIDSVQLHGVVPDAGASWILLAIGAISMAACRLYQKS